MWKEAVVAIWRAIPRFSGDTADKPEKHVSIVGITAKFEKGASQAQVILSIWVIRKYTKNAEYWQGTCLIGKFEALNWGSSIAFVSHSNKQCQNAHGGPSEIPLYCSMWHKPLLLYTEASSLPALINCPFSPNLHPYGPPIIIYVSIRPFQCLK